MLNSHLKLNKTQKAILEALQELYDTYDPVIKNPYYRGSMEKIPTFTIKQVAEKVKKTTATIRKNAIILREMGLIQMSLNRNWKYDPYIYVLLKPDWKPVRLKREQY